MRYRKTLWALLVAVTFVSVVALSAPACRAQGDYLDVYIAKIKPEKISAAEALLKKMAELNRRNHGDYFLAMDTLYGDIGAYLFVSPRQNYAEVDKGSEAFIGALAKSLGQAGAEKLEADFLACVSSAHTEIRHRRPDLSRKVPADLAAYGKLLGTSRVLRATVVHVRPGRAAEFEKLLKEMKEAAEKNPATLPVFVSQLSDGGAGGTYYIASPRSSMGGFDKNPTLKDILGDEGFSKFQKTVSEVVENAETSIYHFRPDLSYPIQAVADADPAFWNPKPAPAAKPKAAAVDTAKPAAQPDAKP